MEKGNGFPADQIIFNVQKPLYITLKSGRGFDIGVMGDNLYCPVMWAGLCSQRITCAESILSTAREIGACDLHFRR